MSLKPSGGGLQQPQEIDWDRIDKNKFFVIGIGAFSGVTSALYPLTVIKTNQQLAHGVQTTGQTTYMIWKERGLAGFYRGYATVIFGTIPARVVYMTALEVTKSAVTKTGKQLGFSDTAIAGSANFLAGGTSSLLTQLITVPIDVVSQRQMVQSQANSQPAPSPHTPSASAAATRGAVPAAPVGHPAGAGSPGLAAAAKVANTATSSSQPAAPSSSGARSTNSAGGGFSARGLHTSAGSVVAPRINTATAPGQPGPQVQLHPRLSLGHAGRQRTVPARVRICAPWLSPALAPHTATLALAPHTSTLASTRAAATSAASAMSSHVSASALPIIRGILRDEGVVGLYRGLGASVATFVPSSAVWWGSYGLYQKTIWNLLGRVPLPGRTMPVGDAGRGGLSGAAAAASAATAAHAATPAATTTTGNVVAVQSAAACLAGFTSAGLTAPLDLIKTRIQVAKKTDGQATTFRAVAADVLREDGWIGMFRAAGPRMMSSALWGTAMVTVYEGLKRVSVKDE